MKTETNIKDLHASLRKVLKNTMTIGDDIPPSDFISTGLPSLDHALGRPGVACGRLTVVRGAPSVGKSSLLYMLLAETQRRGGLAILFETELGIERSRLEMFGVDWNSLYRVQPDCVEETFDLINKTVEAIRAHDEEVLCLIGWDSVAATPVRRELDNDSGDALMGRHANLISAGMRKLTPLIAKHKIALVFVNQFREKMNSGPFQESKTMLGDNPLRFHASMIIDAAQVLVRRTAKGTDPVGANLQFEISKNKLGPPKRRAVVPFYYKTGFDVGQSWLDVGEHTGILKKTGAWWQFPNNEKMQGKEAALCVLNNPELQALIKAKMLEPDIEIEDDLEDD